MPVKKKEGININIKVGDTKSKSKPKRRVVKKPKSKVVYLQPQQTGSLGTQVGSISTGLVRDVNTYTEEVNKRNKALKDKAEEEQKALDIEKKKEESMKRQLELRKGLGESDATLKAYENYLKSPQKKGVMKRPFISKEMEKELGEEYKKEFGEELKSSNVFYDYKKNSVSNPESLKPQQTRMGDDYESTMRELDNLLK
jgi:hypothetical protein